MAYTPSLPEVQSLLSTFKWHGEVIAVAPTSAIPQYPNPLRGERYFDTSLNQFVECRQDRRWTGGIYTTPTVGAVYALRGTGEAFILTSSGWQPYEEFLTALGGFLTSSPGGGGTTIDAVADLTALKASDSGDLVAGDLKVVLSATVGTFTGPALVIWDATLDSSPYASQAQEEPSVIVPDDIWASTQVGAWTNLPAANNARIPTTVVDTLPFEFDNTEAQFAEWDANGSDSAWTGGGGFIIIEDGVDTQYVNVVSNAGGSPTSTEYDTGGGTGYIAGHFANVFQNNLTGGTLTIRPHWEKLALDFEAAFFQVVFTAGTKLYLENTTGRHDLITARACNGIQFPGATGMTPGDTVTIGTTVFTYVAGAPDPASQEFADVYSPGGSGSIALSFADAVNDPASQALLVADLGFAVAATVFPGDSDPTKESVILDSNGNDFSVSESTFGGAMSARNWDSIATAVSVTPGADLS